MKGFSLTEGLLVACIIVVFVVITVSVIDGAKGVAQTAACMSNLRKLYIGLMTYADDNSGYWIGSGENGVTTYTTMIWTGEKKCWLGILYHKYVANLNTFYCPSQKPRNRNAHTNKENFGKKDKKCSSDYEALFFSGHTILLDRLKYKTLVRCGEQDFIASPHEDKDMILRGNGSVSVENH